MRVPRVRFTVRWIMAAVAVVAIGLGVRAQLARWHQLAWYYEIEARKTRRCVAQFRAIGNMSHEQWITYCRAPVDARSRPPTSNLLICGILTWSQVRRFCVTGDRVDEAQIGARIGELGRVKVLQ